MKKAILEVKRRWLSSECAVGELSLNGKLFCYSLEDVVRAPGVKVKHETAIPAGTYVVTLETSPRFGKLLPRLHNVPGFDGILLHSGNTAADSSGCILVGYSKLQNNRRIYNNVAGAALRDLLAKLLEFDTIEITVS